MTYTVLICDDTLDVGVDLAEQVRNVAPAAHYNVLKAPAKEDVLCAIKELFARHNAMLGQRQRGRSACLFDEADILILDYDLLHIDEENARHTSESLARLARLFSNADVIVVYNQFQGAHFDLSLRGNLSSHADLNLDADLLGTPGLWTDPPWDGFRPWHWQTLREAVDTQRARRAWVQEHMEEPIVDALGMEQDDAMRLSDTAFGFIAADAKDWPGLSRHTFSDFIRRPASGMCASTLLESDPDAACRFAGARIGKWLERRVLGPQDVLVDLPHLVQFYPFLLGDDMMELEAWNAAVRGKDELESRIPDACWFGPQGVLSRPAVWAQRFEQDADIREARGTFDFSSCPPFVFLEDMSTFAPLDTAKQFRAGHNTASDHRFARCIDGLSYEPQRRLAFAG